MALEQDLAINSPLPRLGLALVYRTIDPNPDIATSL